MMKRRRKTKYAHEGRYVAEVEVELVEDESGWSPYLSVDDASRLDDVREVLREGNLQAATRHGRVYELRPVAQQSDWFASPPEPEAAQAHRAVGVVHMIPRITRAEYRQDYKVWLCFSDGVEGEIDLEDELWGEVFEPLKDKAEFRKFRLDPELSTLVWPNDADLAPEFLYEKLRPGYTLTPGGKTGVA